MGGMTQHFTVDSVSTEDADFSQNYVLLLPNILILIIFFPQHTGNTCAYIHVQYTSFLFTHLIYINLDSFEFRLLYTLNVILANEFSVLSIQEVYVMGSVL
jgi:hypothetical protein